VDSAEKHHNSLIAAHDRELMAADDSEFNPAGPSGTSGVETSVSSMSPRYPEPSAHATFEETLFAHSSAPPDAPRWSITDGPFYDDFQHAEEDNEIADYYADDDEDDDEEAVHGLEDDADPLFAPRMETYVPLPRIRTTTTTDPNAMETMDLYPANAESRPSRDIAAFPRPARDSDDELVRSEEEREQAMVDVLKMDEMEAEEQGKLVFSGSEIDFFTEDDDVAQPRRGRSARRTSAPTARSSAGPSRLLHSVLASDASDDNGDVSGREPLSGKRKRAASGERTPASTKKLKGKEKVVDVAPPSETEHLEKDYGNERGGGGSIQPPCAPRKKTKFKYLQFRIGHTIALLYLAAVLARQPVLMQDYVTCVLFFIFFYFWGVLFYFLSLLTSQ
jgi:hypothetical protein